jgi:hypothetical protein
VLNRLRAGKIKMRIFAEMLMQMSKILAYFAQIARKAHKFHLTVTIGAKSALKLLYELQGFTVMCLVG